MLFDPKARKKKKKDRKIKVEHNSYSETLMLDTQFKVFPR